jgi:hypothetical protein
MHNSVRLLIAFACFVAIAAIEAHPIPDIPVRAYFNADGSATIRVEVDTRCFVADPEKEPYLQNWVLKEMSEKERKAMTGKASDYVLKNIRFFFRPLSINPEFEFRFTSFDNKPLEKVDDPVMVTGEWRTKVPKGIEGYQIEALDSGSIDIQFINHFNGQLLEKSHCVLFPGEKSILLDLTEMTATAPAKAAKGSVSVRDTGGGGWHTMWQFLRKGFRHVMPDGLDHVLFVLGLFFLSREWRPLLYQVSMFTAAHTITLALATLGVVRVSAAVVEPVIAASIAFVALENIYRTKYSHWRLLVVFCFGLIHGLGFAGVLSEYALPPTSLVIGLIGFNVGVEFGQLAVIALAFGITFWVRDALQYRRYVVVPVSVAIAMIGAYWTIERAFTMRSGPTAPSETAPVTAAAAAPTPAN